jgi:hypothetical protein
VLRLSYVIHAVVPFEASLNVCQVYILYLIKKYHCVPHGGYGTTVSSPRQARQKTLHTQQQSTPDNKRGMQVGSRRGEGGEKRGAKGGGGGGGGRGLSCLRHMHNIHNKLQHD